MEKLVEQARHLLEQAKLSNADPDLIAWAELVQEYIEELDKHVFLVSTKLVPPD